MFRSRHKPIAWEHGWKTNRVVASRMHNDLMGWNIKFVFPKDPNECDRAEISDLIEVRGGNVFEGGGYPGAPLFATFESVIDRDSADRKLQEFLPELDQLMDDISDGKKIKPIKPPAEPLTMEQWIAKVNAKKRKCDGKEGEWRGSGSNGFNSWTIRCVGGFEVYEDTTKKTQEMLAEEQAHKQQLIEALTSRALTDAELKEVGQYGSNLLTQPMVPYQQQDVDSRFQSMMTIQQAFRARVRP